MMKQKTVLQTLIAFLALYNLFFMPLQTSILTLIGAFALYGMTNELMVPAFILFISPLIVLSVKMYKKSGEGFQAKGAEAVSERVRGMQAAPQPKPSTGPAGVLEMVGIENFQDVSTTSVAPAESAVSVPAFVKDKGRMLVVPESSVANIGSVDRNPQANPALITGEDESSVNTALVPEATKLGNANQPASAASMSVGPSQAPLM
jgi:hypothetical protein